MQELIACLSEIHKVECVLFSFVQFLACMNYQLGHSMSRLHTVIDVATVQYIDQKFLHMFEMSRVPLSLLKSARFLGSTDFYRLSCSLKKSRLRRSWPTFDVVSPILTSSSTSRPWWIETRSSSTRSSHRTSRRWCRSFTPRLSVEHAMIMASFLENPGEHIGRVVFSNTIFVCVKPYVVPGEPRRDPSNRMLNEVACVWTICEISLWWAIWRPHVYQMCVFWFI